jgi:GT2 family glycosyltransferase
VAAHVMQVELAGPRPALPPLPQGWDVLALVWQRGRPVGLLRLRPDSTGSISQARWRAALDDWARRRGTRHGQPPLGQANAAAGRRRAFARPLSVDDWGTPLAAGRERQDAAAIRAARRQPVSIVIATHERPDDLLRCLEAMLPLMRAGHEVLVVDNAPVTERTARVAAEYPVRYLVEPRPGQNNARNLGWQAATHGLVAFTDDDALPDPGWPEAIARAFARSPAAGLTGLVLPLELETEAQELFERYCQHKRRFKPAAWAREAAPGVAALSPAEAGLAGMGANMAFRREWLAWLGGFDPRFDGGTPTCSGGDTDMFARLLEAGGRIDYVPQALVWHRHRREAAELRRCLFGYGVGQYSFFAKRVFEAGDLAAAVTAARWLAGPPLKAAANRLRGRPAMPLHCLLPELAGACLGPLRFWRVAAGGTPATAPKPAPERA